MGEEIAQPQLLSAHHRPHGPQFPPVETRYPLGLDRNGDFEAIVYHGKPKEAEIDIAFRVAEGWFCPDAMFQRSAVELKVGGLANVP